MRRVLRIKLFFASTIEEIDFQITKFLVDEQICVGNYVESGLAKLGNIYQFKLIYAEADDSEEEDPNDWDDNEEDSADNVEDDDEDEDNDENNSNAAKNNGKRPVIKILEEMRIKEGSSLLEFAKKCNIQYNQYHQYTLHPEKNLRDKTIRRIASSLDVSPTIFGLEEDGTESESIHDEYANEGDKPVHDQESARMNLNVFKSTEGFTRGHKAFAEKCEMNPDVMKEILDGTRKIKLGHVKQIAKKFDIDPAALLDSD